MGSISNVPSMSSNVTFEPDAIGGGEAFDSHDMVSSSVGARMAGVSLTKKSETVGDARKYCVLNTSVSCPDA